MNGKKHPPTPFEGGLIVGNSSKLFRGSKSQTVPSSAGNSHDCSCPVCGSDVIEEFLSRKNVPVHQNLLCDSRESALKINRGNLDLVVCLNCQFIFNKSFELSKLSYGKDYDNTQTYSPFFNNYFDELINYLLNEKNIKNSNIIEVGCGKGLFIKKVISNLKANNTGYGFDPSYTGAEIEFLGHLKYKNDYYGQNYSDIKADIIICRHVIEHVPQPMELLLTIMEAVKNSSKVQIFFETPCIEWIIKNKAIFDLFYEHCSYFNINSLIELFNRAGFNVEKVNKIFGEQYLWLEATKRESGERFRSVPYKYVPCEQTHNETTTFKKSLEKFRQIEVEFTDFWTKKIKKLMTEGSVAVWGAGAKGVTFANLIDPENKLINCFIDLNPKKCGNFIPGTGHKIIDWQEISNYNIKYAIVMNANYIEEINSTLTKSGLNISLIDLVGCFEGLRNNESN